MIEYLCSLFFFFKQKTAYEMRISDWSSDVCFPISYLHVHPRGAPEDDATEPGPRIAFGTSAPSAGAYRLFLDFKHDGVVRTAAFTVHAESDTTAHDDGADHEH